MKEICPAPSTEKIKVMNSSPSIETLDPLFREAGSVRWGCTRTGVISPTDRAIYSHWMASGYYGNMAFVLRNNDVRSNPELLLEGAKTLFCSAFSYKRDTHHPFISDYALGTDYHIALRQALSPVAQYITQNYGGETRICIDTAPLRERYWAEQCGVGRNGLSGRLLVPGVGSAVVLGFILWTGSLPAYSEPLQDDVCLHCKKCIKACPSGALQGDGSVDARRCIAYLTIEHRGELPAPLPGHCAFGCDICQRVCPVGEHLPSPACIMTERQDIMTLDEEALRSMSAGAYKRLTHETALSRAPLKQLLRNLSAIKKSH